ncbi:MAG TPA: T9SS type A sorting domain-containing protein [Bacteroidales bacterium]|nr:T9SS type A sorting domain-containing protein [Bacteroidales bacterium]
MKKLSLILIIMCWFSYYTNAQNYFVNEMTDTIDVSTTWAYDTVFVDTSLIILDNVILSIEPGSKIVFRGFHKIMVEGTIQSIGTPADSIIYTVCDTTGYHLYDHTGWDGIEFDNETGNMADNDTSCFKYCGFYFGYNKDNDWNEGTGGAIKLRYNAFASFTNCTFAYNTTLQWGGAIGLVFDATAIIDSCIFLHNNAIYNGYSCGGGAIAIGCENDIELFDQTIISNCYFYKNSSFYDANEYESGHGGGAIKISGHSDALVMNCAFTQNYSTTQGGAMIVSGYAHPYVINNLFFENSADHNGAAVGIKYYAGGYHINNTVVSNNSGNYGGAYSIGCYNDSCFFANNIIGGNTDQGGYAQIYIDSPDEYMQFYNNNIENGLTLYEAYITISNNINTDPLWINPAGGDFRLTCGSPCIDYGIDIDTLLSEISLDIIGVPRLVNGAYDLGAYETQLPIPVNLGNDTVICNGETVILDAGTNYTSYLWSNSEDTQTIEIQTENTYSVTVSNEYLCETSDDIYIEVNELPNPIAGEDDTQTCSLEYVLDANSPTNSEIGIWTISSGGTGSFDNEYLPNAIFTADAIGTYTLTWTLDNGNCQNSDDIEITFEEDIINPTINCVENQIIELEQGQTNFMVENTGLDAIVNDNCEIANLINDYTNTESLYDASFEIGTTTVTWTATDIAGNENTCSFDITVNAWVGIETLKRKDISIYPNPTTGHVSIDFINSNNFEIIRKIEISDIAGKIIMKKDITNQQVNLDFSNYSNGIYLINIITDTEIITEKIIKK